MGAMRAAGLLLAAASAAPAAAQDGVAFQSPSGNIHCMIFASDGTGARCDILAHSPSFRGPPPGCDLDGGSAFWVPTRGRAQVLCAGDTVADPLSPVLGYGGSISQAGITCVSERTGMTCRNAQGSGFTLSRARQSVF